MNGIGLKQIEDRAEKLQQQCHHQVEYATRQNPKITVQDATNVWLFYKLAELELAVELLEEKQNQI